MLEFTFCDRAYKADKAKKAEGMGWIAMKNILITGASRGIGRAAALRMAGTECGLFLNSFSGGEKLEETADAARKIRSERNIAGEVYTLKADVGDPEAVRQMFKKIDTVLKSSVPEGWQGIDILINNAGISHIGLVQDMSDEEWDRIIAVNLSSVHYCSRAVIPHMLAKGGGRIINISSVWGENGASCEVAYSASKGGVNAYTKALAKELAPSGIAVNAIACGCIDTDMNGHFTDEERKMICDGIPSGRFADPDEVAGLIAALCDQSPYLTGQIITIDGGWT